MTQPIEGEQRLDVSVTMSGRTALGLRYVLPLVATACEAADADGETTAMLEQATQDIDAALPQEFRGAIDSAEIAERRMDAIEVQRDAGVRPRALVPADHPALLSKEEARVIASVLNGSGLGISPVARRLAAFAEQDDSDTKGEADDCAEAAKAARDSVGEAR
jgi:hypothetical protein